MFQFAFILAATKQGAQVKPELYPCSMKIPFIKMRLEGGTRDTFYSMEALHVIVTMGLGLQSLQSSSNWVVKSEVIQGEARVVKRSCEQQLYVFNIQSVVEGRAGR